MNVKLLKWERHDKKHEGYHANIISAYILDDGVKKNLTFYKQKDSKKYPWGTEVYVGKNYIVGSRLNSYSRNYGEWKGLPKKYMDVAKKLRTIHKITYGW